jgi:hypothetical protein
MEDTSCIGSEHKSPKSIKGYEEDLPHLEGKDLADRQTLVIRAHVPGVLLRREIDIDVQDKLLIQSIGRNDG